MPEPKNVSPAEANNPEALSRALEIELMLKRSSWEKGRARRSLWRTLSLLFFFMIIVATLLAYYFLLPRLQKGESRAHPAQTETVR